jgi:glyoxylase-like metal-dependent hydrolase (beta-lactamase superfamily II)
MKIHTIDLHFMNVERSIAAYAVEGPEGVALVECGPHSTIAYLQKGLERFGFRLEAIRHVFLSHIHFDHAGAAWVLAGQGATVYVHPVGLPHLAAPEKLYNSAKQIYGDQMETLWGRMEPVPMAQLYAPAHEEVIAACGLQFKAIFTPGHAVHHIAWEVSEQ